MQMLEGFNDNICQASWTLIIGHCDHSLQSLLCFYLFSSWKPLSVLTFRASEYFQLDSHLGVCSRLRLASWGTLSMRQFLVLPRGVLCDIPEAFPVPVPGPWAFCANILNSERESWEAPRIVVWGQGS